MFVFTVFVGKLGTEVLAANEIALNVMSFGFMPAFAFGSTATILVWQEIGKGHSILGRRLGSEIAVLGCAFLLLLGIVEFIWAEQIVMLYTKYKDVALLASGLITVAAFLQIFEGLLNFYAGGLRGIGETSFLLRISLILTWVLFIPLTYVLTFVFKLSSYGAWVALNTYLLFFGLAVMLRFYRRDWVLIKKKTTDAYI